MKLKKFGGTEQKVYDLVKPVTDELGYYLWDVSYVKEGAMWYLRIFIDQDEGITIEDCEKVTEPVNQILDEKDPIAQSYILEVSSPGLEADLIRESHFDACLGCEVRVRGFRDFENGSRELVGILKDWNKEFITLQTPDQTLELPFSALTFVKLYFEFD